MSDASLPVVPVVKPPSLKSLGMSAELSRFLDPVALTVGEAPMPVAAAADLIAQDPGLRLEVRNRKAEIEATIAPCGENAVRALLSPLVLVFGVSDGARKPQFWTQYMKALADVPLHGLIEACDGWCKRPDAEFFPKPGPLRDMAMKASAAAYRAVAIARRLEGMAAPVERRPPTDEERAEVRRLAAMPLKRMDAVG